MRVLMINRNDAYSVPGGDTVQMVQTKIQLEKLGIEIEDSAIDGFSINKGYDLIHIFNCDMMEQFFSSSIPLKVTHS